MRGTARRYDRGDVSLVLGGGSGGGADAGGELMGAEALERYLIPDAELMKYKGYVFDIVTPDSKRCSCFTKAYSKYIRGTGSLLSTNFYDDDGKCFFDTADPWSVQVRCRRVVYS